MSHSFSLSPSVALASGLALALATAGEPVNPRAAARRSAEPAVLILSTTSNRGEVEPCG